MRRLSLGHQQAIAEGIVLGVWLGSLLGIYIIPRLLEKVPAWYLLLVLGTLCFPVGKASLRHIQKILAESEKTLP